MTAPAAPPEPPGRTLGIIGLVVAIFASLIGLIISIVAKVQSNRVGVRNPWATAGIVVGAIRVGADVLAVILLLSLHVASGALS